MKASTDRVIGRMTNDLFDMNFASTNDPEGSSSIFGGAGKVSFNGSADPDLQRMEYFATKTGNETASLSGGGGKPYVPLSELRNPETLKNRDKLYSIYNSALDNSRSLYYGLSPEATSMKIAQVYQGVFSADDTAVWFGFAPYAVAKVGQTYADLKQFGRIDQNDASVIRAGFFEGNKGIFDSMYTAEQIYQAGGTAAIKAMQEQGITFNGKFNEKTIGYENSLINAFEQRDAVKEYRSSGDYAKANTALENSLVSFADFEQRVVIQQYYNKPYTIQNSDGSSYTNTLGEALKGMQNASIGIARATGQQIGNRALPIVGDYLGNKAADFARNTIQEKTRVTILGQSSEGSIFRKDDVSIIKDRMPFVYSAAKDYLSTYSETNRMEWQQRILMDQRTILQNIYGTQIYQLPRIAPGLPGANYLKR